MPQRIYPIETGYIIDETIDIGSKKGGHIQGIVHLGDEYTALSTDIENQELIVARGFGSRKKVVFDQSIPGDFEHAGGIDALKVGNLNDDWMIVVPVYYKNIRRNFDTKDKGAILHYRFFNRNGIRVLERRHITTIEGMKAYAAGIARNESKVLIAVVVDDDGNKVKFLQCDAANGQGEYEELGCVWDSNDVPDSERNSWQPDSRWARYPNSISLIEHDGRIYFVGLDGPGGGQGDEYVEIYSVCLDKNAGNNRLTKKLRFHAICNEPSFRWGGSARICDGAVEVLAVERNVQRNTIQGNVYVRYDKFRFAVDPTGPL